MSTYGLDTIRRYTPIGTDSSAWVPHFQPVLLVFDGEALDCGVRRLGHIEVQGGQGAATSDLLEHLKFEAFKHGANVVVGVHDNYVQRKTGKLFSKTEPEVYSSHIFTGIAGRIPDSVFQTRVAKTDTSYIRRIIRADAAESRRSVNEIWLSFFAVIFTIGLLIYLVAAKGGQ